MEMLNKHYICCIIFGGGTILLCFTLVRCFAFIIFDVGDMKDFEYYIVRL